MGNDNPAVALKIIKNTENWGVITHTGMCPYADTVTFVEKRYLSAKNVCKAMINESWRTHTRMSEGVYNHATNAEKVSSAGDKERLNYLLEVFMLRKFKDYANSNECGAAIHKLDEEKIKEMVSRW